MGMDWIEIQLVGLSPSVSQEERFVVVLATLDTRRRLPIIIGKPEAQAIAVTVEGIQPLRPLPYDSWLASLATLGGTITKVLVERVEEDIFYTYLLVEGPDAQIHRIDIRPSDAIALAVRCQARMYTTQAVLEYASYGEEQSDKLPKRGSLTHYSLAELELLLERLLAKEDYQSAVRIRDLIEQRKQR
ncbi:MAG: bifunctional nuclease family protein [Bacteroidetes bacterium]|nr:MAG: bifunctional nuclease family protein [Bacteroidota bacterium]